MYLTGRMRFGEMTNRSMQDNMGQKRYEKYAYCREV